MTKHLALGLATMLLGLGGSAYGGEEPEGAEKPQMYTIYTEVVKPGMIQQYEAAMKHMIDEFAAYQIDPEKIHWKCVSGPEIGYVYVMPIENFASIDEEHRNWMEALEIIGAENFEEIVAPAGEAMDHVEVFQAMRMPELSYVPEHPRLKEGDVKYIHYGFYYALPGKAEDVEAIAKEFVDLYQAKGIDTGWSFYKILSGSDLPLFVVAQGAKSPADYYANREKIKEALGPEGREIGMKVGATIRRSEYKEGTIRPDLAYPQPDLTTGQKHAH
jgi:hypothetical protein